ncbi:protein phosphatase 2C family protein [Candidatus Nomurabacteria bacterium]|nr:protein phosphatase 2C family protein [Candidatus Nomurabacteria bacterium]
MKQSIRNFIDKNSESENEDFIFEKENDIYSLFSLSDGAGGDGIFCGSWAEFLSTNQPSAPFFSVEDAKKWFLEISKKFHDAQLLSITKENPFVEEKFYHEGSYATLIYCWISKEEYRLYYTGVGDSTLFIFSKDKSDYITKLIFPINQQQRLNQSPNLLNWRRELKHNLLSNEFNISSKDKIIICSDSFARWLLLNLLVLDCNNTQQLLNPDMISDINSEFIDYLEYIKTTKKYSSVSNLLSVIKEMLFDKDVFQDTLSKLIEQNELVKDDFSVIFLERV